MIFCMIRTLLATVVLLIHTGHAAEHARMIAFERSAAVWVANPDGSGAKKIAAGANPDISPDGTKVAFTHLSGGAAGDRHIAVADVATGKAVIFKKEIPSNNSFRPVWSPDGAQILFQIFTGDKWHLALVNADGGGFRYVKKATATNDSFWSSCWAPDGRSIYMQDLDNLHQIGLDGAEIKSWKLESLIPKGSFSSASRFAVSPDGHTLLMEVEMDEPIVRKDWEGPPPALWTLDLATQKLTRLTPKGLFGMDGCWSGDAEIIFTSQAAGEKDASLHRLSLPGNERKQFLKKASSPSISR